MVYGGLLRAVWYVVIGRAVIVIIYRELLYGDTKSWYTVLYGNTMNWKTALYGDTMITPQQAVDHPSDAMLDMHYAAVIYRSFSVWWYRR